MTNKKDIELDENGLKVMAKVVPKVEPNNEGTLKSSEESHRGYSSETNGDEFNSMYNRPIEDGRNEGNTPRINGDEFEPVDIFSWKKFYNPDYGSNVINYQGRSPSYQLDCRDNSSSLLLDRKELAPVIRSNVGLDSYAFPSKEIKSELHCALDWYNNSMVLNFFYERHIYYDDQESRNSKPRYEPIPSISKAVIFRITALGEEHEEIYYSFLWSHGRAKPILVKNSMLDERLMRKIFREAGIKPNFPKGLKADFYNEFLTLAKRYAFEAPIPLAPGWNINGRIFFCNDPKKTLLGIESSDRLVDRRETVCRMDLFILKSMAVNLVLLRYYEKKIGVKLTPSQPIGLVLDPNVDMSSIMNQITSNPIIIQTTTKMEDAEKELQRAQSRAAFYIVPPMYQKYTKKRDERMQLFHEAAASSIISGKKVESIYFFIFSGHNHIEESSESIVTLYVTNQAPNGEVNAEYYSSYNIFNTPLVHPGPDYPKDASALELDLMEDRLREMVAEVSGEWERIFMAPVMCMFTQFKNEGRMNEYDALRFTALEMAKAVEESQKEYSTLICHVSNVLMDYSSLCRVVTLPIITEVDKSHRDELLFVDFYKERVYITQNLFKGILSNVLELTRIDDVKKALRSKEFILHDSRSSYTCEMTYEINGNKEHIRMICLDATKIYDRMGIGILEKLNRRNAD